MLRSSRSVGMAAALVAAFMLATAAHAGDPIKCQKEIAKDFSKYVQAKTKALKKCREGIVKGTPNTCPDTTATAKIAKAETKMRVGIGKQCGGATKSCTDGDAVALAGIGWTMGTCPNFENGACTNPITNCNGIADCLACVGEAAVDQAIGLYYDNLVAGEFGTGSAVNKCQIAIGKNATKFIAAKNKALQKCEDQVLKTTITGPCPDAVKAQPAIDKAQTKMQAGICKACGGADKLCNGTNDLDPIAQIGFPASCPNVTVPGGLPCTGTITTLQDLVNCLTCVSEYKDDCLDPIAVPSVKPVYPTECNAPAAPPCASTPQNTATPCPTSTPGVTCPTQVMTEVNGPAVDFDIGWSGESHDHHAPSQNRLTLAVSLCSNPDASTCGVCNTSGPLPNAGGTAYNTQRCVLDTSVQCTSDANCSSLPRQCINSSACSGGSNPGAACTVSTECPGGYCLSRTCTSDGDCPGGTCSPSVCSFFFGSPLPFSTGGVGFCLTNQITAPITGTVDVEGGATATTIQLLSRVYDGDVSRPCPTCDHTLRCGGGANVNAICSVDSQCPGSTCTFPGLTCSDGPRDGQACVVNGASPLFGDVSFDCPPNPAANLGKLPSTRNYQTGAQAVTLSAANPTCRATGFTGEKCLCDTCNNAAGTTCTSNADCVGVGATVCGGKRCLSGSNLGSPCSVPADCPAQCFGGTNDGGICTVNSDCPGASCVGGANANVVCSADSECPGGQCFSADCPAFCGVPGAPTRPNECNDATCSSTMTCGGGCNDFLNCTGAFKCVGGSNVDALCTVDSECPGGSCNEQCPGGACVVGGEGTCAAGPFEQFCAIETYRGCLHDTDCHKPGDSCTLGKFRDCFTDNGVIGGAVTATGVPSPSCGGAGSGVVGALFCVPPTSSSSVNTVFGLPGLGRITQPYTVTFN
jgi:hypothetical protein